MMLSNYLRTMGLLLENYERLYAAISICHA